MHACDVCVCVCVCVCVHPHPHPHTQGILIFCDKELREAMNLRIFVDVEADQRILRRIERDLVQVFSTSLVST
jgi:hypothetical protein